ncbi:signal peptidase I [Blastococcus aurantiacus]|uniref:Signal peptidase I n=1 Tax=Blastococcus aurantiacus TaxID=1550231 RepID=A0A1G7Q8J9_9ACTN|nr:signal peptidase I [Blastococcus aurantiacus]SDF94851.1 signal peptidase I [Blastococcus aurantiacus]
MSNAVKAASTSAVVALVLAAVWLFWPVQLGGATVYVTTHGVSMEPGFSTGDLAVLRPADAYEVGDVVAYHSGTLDTVVMHRIVAVDGDRFVLQGDNNDWLDEDRPTSDELLGRLFRQVPQGGKVLAAIASPWSLTLIGAVVVGLVGTGTARRPKGRHAARPRATGSRAPAALTLPTAFSMPTRAQARQIAVASGAVAILAAGAGAVLLALPSTETQVRSQPVTQEGRYTYAGVAEAGTTYPTGVISTGDPIYTKLADALTVSFEHGVTAPGLDEVEGDLRLDLSVATSDGWTAALGSSPTVPVRDGTATATADLDPTLAAALVGRHNAEIGGNAGSATIVVTPVVAVRGSLQGKPFTAADLDPLAFTMDTMSLRPPAVDAAFTPAGSIPVSVDEVVPRSFTALGVDLPIDAARVVAVAVLLAALLVTAIAGGISHSTSGNAADAFAVRNAARILPVTGLTPGGSVVDVSDAQALRRVAERVDGLVLHHAGPEGQTFAVQDNETTYRFVFPDTAITRTPPPPPPPPVLVSLAAPATSPLPRIA